MSTVLELTDVSPLVLHFGPIVRRMTDHEFFEFCQRNQDWRIERTADGDLIVMAPTGGTTGQRNATLTRLFGNWAETDGTGIVFDSSTVFTLPNGASRSPDVSWVRRSRWEALSDEEQEEFPPLCPDFVLELRSPSDRLSILKSKMEEYIEQGAALGWLLDPMGKNVYIYHPNALVECLEDPESLSGEPTLPGFVLHLADVW
jgi:Uma2 family endonuclease